MRILFLSTWMPYPPTNGSKLRAYNLLRVLAQRHAVTLITLAPSGTEPPAAALRALCTDVHVVPATPFHPRSLRALAGTVLGTPRSLVATFSASMVRCIEATLSRGDIDAVVASQLPTARYAPVFSATPAVFEEVELGVLWDEFTRAPTALGRARYGLTWLKHRRYLAGLLRHFRACTVVSEPERRLICAAVPGAPRVDVIPNAVDATAAARVVAERDADGPIFAGPLGYEPNLDAMQWFAADIFPEIRRGWPAAHLTITGDPAGRALPPTLGIAVVGQVDDIGLAVASAAVSVAPIRLGGGTRVKILEAMALGTPVVATSKAAEGLDVVHGEHLLIADDGREFADHVVHLLNDPALRHRLSVQGRDLIARQYDWAVVGPRFAALLEEVV
jgi:glycosyltransferase involved in cell wall biosynthesis